MLRSPDFYQAIAAATSSVRTLMQEKNADSLQAVKSSLVAVSRIQLAECDPKTAASLDGTLAALDSWSASQSQVAAAQKELDEANKRLTAAKLSLQEAETQASTAESDNRERVSKTLPSLYAGLKRWARASGGGSIDAAASPPLGSKSSIS